MLRRNLLTASGMASVLLITGCATSTGTPAVTLDMAKAYLDAAALALQAAAQQYEVGPPAPSAANLALVKGIATQLETVRVALDGTTAPTDYKSGLLQAISLMQELSPMVTPFLGAAAAPYVPLALAVLQAFVASLPPPASAPAVPPAALALKGMEYHRQ